MTTNTDVSLPAPTTSRDLRPRSRTTSLARASGSRSASRLSSRSGSLASSHNSSAAVGQQDAGVGALTDRQSGKWSATSSESGDDGRKRSKTSPRATGKGKGKAVDDSGPTDAIVHAEFITEEALDSVIPSDTLALEPLSSYCCPICFSPPTNATLTPCGHICCGSCLFTAVKTTLQRSQLLVAGELAIARCPVCREPIPGWNSRGGGVIGLKTRAVFTV
jgi:hypothetical protein